VNTGSGIDPQYIIVPVVHRLGKNTATRTKPLIEGLFAEVTEKPGGIDVNLAGEGQHPGWTGIPLECDSASHEVVGATATPKAQRKRTCRIPSKTAQHTVTAKITAIRQAAREQGNRGLVTAPPYV
jgi:hypothetical protein